MPLRAGVLWYARYYYSSHIRERLGKFGQTHSLVGVKVSKVVTVSEDIRQVVGSKAVKNSNQINIVLQLCIS